MRRRGVAAIAAGLVLCLPTAALAQEADASAEDEAVGVGEADSAERAPSQDAEQTPPDETGIGEPDAVECRGSIAARVVDLDGTPVDGAVLAVAGEQLVGSGQVESLCGEVAATLLAAPEGYAPAGPTTMHAQVRNAATTPITFTVDPVEVLGTQVEQPSPEVPDASLQDAATPRAEADPELAATGPEDAPILLLLALLHLLAGTALVVAAPPRARVRG